VIGSGAVGAEFASCYSRYGTKTVLVEVLPRLLPVEDEEVRRKSRSRSERRDRLSPEDGRRGRHAESGRHRDRRRHRPAGETLSWTVDKVLLAVGRRPVTEGLGLEASGVRTEKGYVVVDAFQRTSVPNVFAIGDVTPTIWLAHVASAEGIVAAETIAGVPTRPINRDQVPGCTYTDPRSPRSD